MKLRVICDFEFVLIVLGVKFFCDEFDAHHAFCAKHIQRNANEVAKKASPREDLSSKLFWKLAKSESEASYGKTLKTLKSVAPTTATYLNNIEHSRWALYAIADAGCFT